MKLKCIKSFEVSKGIFQYLFNKDVIYDTYMKDNEIYIKQKLVGIKYEDYKEYFEIINEE